MPDRFATFVMFDAPLILRRANAPRKGEWTYDDYDVFDGDSEVGRIYRLNAAKEIWFWGIASVLVLTDRKSYGTATSLAKAKAAFRAEYEKSRSGR